MKTLILVILLTLSANADIWSKMFSVHRVENNQQNSVSMVEIDINGIQAGYIDYYQGMDNYVPIRNPFYDGYAIGAIRAKKEIESRNRFDNGINDYYQEHRYNNRKEYYNGNDNYQEIPDRRFNNYNQKVNDSTETRFYDH